MHEFESWFSDSKEYEKLKKKNLIECIYCNSKHVEKSIMSPNVVASNLEKTINNKEFADFKKNLTKIKKYIEKNFEFVGDKFPQEVREIYYDNKKKKNIYGTATLKEKIELEEEGIELATIPWVDSKEN
jgi:hypothetical protein